MVESSTPWSGTWVDVTDPLATNDELILSVASRRNCPNEAIRTELTLIDTHFDVDAVYLSRD